MNCIVGFKKVDYVNKEGRRVEGFKLYLLDDFSGGDSAPKNVYGSVTSEEWLSRKICDENSYSPVIGDYVSFQYNKFGQLISFSVNQ